MNDTTETQLPRSFEDFVVPFSINKSFLTGRMVRLGEVINTILTRHKYPEPISRYLGELLVLTAMLSATLKYEGIFSIQVKGKSGPLRFLVADCTSEGALRGYASFDRESYDALENHGLQDLLGEKGLLAITVDQGKEGESYQGLVELEGNNLEDAILKYFTQSEQLEVVIRVSVGLSQFKGEEQQWFAGGIMVQRLPEEEVEQADADIDPEEAWQSAKAFILSSKDHELIDPLLPPKELLFRLFHEEGVWVADRKKLRHECRCSRDKVKTALQSIPKEELHAMEEDGRVVVTCQFCSEERVFTHDEIEQIAQS